MTTPPDVAAVFKRYPSSVRRQMMALRALILATARTIDGVGAIEETLKWGEPAYLTSATRSGSTIRLGWNAARPAEYSLLFNCRTTLVASFRADFGDRFRYDGSRAIVFSTTEPLPSAELAFCIAAALTYHRRRKPSGR